MDSDMLTILQRSTIPNRDDTYPDRAATPLSDGSFPINDPCSTLRHGEEIPTTTDDMSALFQWEHGDEVRGTQAAKHPGMKRYIEDINKAYGKEGSYKDIYIDTFKPIGEQLKKFKR